MKCKLEEIADVILGSIVTRIKSNREEGTSIESITMQELSYYCNQTDVFPENNIINIDSKKLETCVLTKKDDVLIGLNSGKAMVIEEERANKLVLSNFAVIRIKDKNIVDPYYLAWLINESDEAKKQLFVSSQRTLRVMLIPLINIKNLELNICDIDKQHKIGHTYSLIRLNTRTKRDKTNTLYKLVNVKLNELQK